MKRMSFLVWSISLLILKFNLKALLFNFRFRGFSGIFFVF